MHKYPNTHTPKPNKLTKRFGWSKIAFSYYIKGEKLFYHSPRRQNVSQEEFMRRCCLKPTVSLRRCTLLTSDKTISPLVTSPKRPYKKLEPPMFLSSSASSRLLSLSVSLFYSLFYFMFLLKGGYRSFVVSFLWVTEYIQRRREILLDSQHRTHRLFSVCDRVVSSPRIRL